jgi:myo-inositol-1(or 4)-monophosphatase
MSELNIAIEAARLAGQALRDRYNKPHQVTFKGVIDMVTEMDRLSESLVTGMLRNAYPDYGILGEEGSKSTEPYTSRWIIDPLDGTTNYKNNYPLFGVSIGLEKQGEIVVGVVYNPVLDEMFSAEKGKGALLNGSPIHVTDTPELGKSLVATGFPYDAWTSPANNCAELERFVKSVISLRSDGSAALDLCHIACGRLDGYWELDLEPWDMAAGALIVQEAGGRVTQVNGEPFSHLKRSILANNGLIHQAMVEKLKG